MRICKDCSVELIWSNSRRADGLLCRKCRSARQTLAQQNYSPERRTVFLANMRQWHEANKNHVKENARINYAIHEDERKANNKYWRAANIERATTSSRRYYLANSETIKARVMEWSRANPERIRVYSENRRAAKLGTSTPITQQEWSDILDVFNHSCAYCLESGVPMEMEHVQALARGGTHSADNIVPACRRCNARKNASGILKMVNQTFRKAG